MRAAHSNLQRQNTMHFHKKYVILHLLLMRFIVDTRWAEGAKRLCFTCGACETQALNSLGPVHLSSYFSPSTENKLRYAITLLYFIFAI